MPRLPPPRLPRPGGVFDRVRSGARRVRYAVSDGAYWVRTRVRAATRAVGDGVIPDRIAARLGRVGVAIRDAAARTRERLRWLRFRAGGLSERARAAWSRLSHASRRLVLAAVALPAAAAVIWLAAVPNLPCQFPGGDRCPPPDDAAELVPADALAYLHANLDSETAQAEAATELFSRAPLLSAQLLSLLPLPGGGGVDFARDVRPWLEGEVALALIAGEGGAPEQVYLFEADESEGAERFARGLTGSGASTSERDGVEVKLGPRGVASALVDGFLVIGTEVAVQRIIDTRGEARSLADSEIAETVADGLPDDSLAQAFVSEDGVRRLLAGGEGFLSTMEIFVDFEATLGAGAALVAADDGFELEIHSELDSERVEASPGFFDAFTPFEPTIPERLAPRSLAYLGLGDPETSIRRLLEQAQSDAPALVAGYEGFVKQLMKEGDVNLEDELLPLLGGEAALVIQPPDASPGRRAGGEAESEIRELPESPDLESEAPGEAPAEDVAPVPLDPRGVVAASGIPYLTFIATEIDADTATDALAKLQAPLAVAFAGGDSGQAPTFEQGEVEGVEVNSVSLSPAVDLTYAIFDAALVIATQPEGVARVAAGPGGLNEAPPYERATEDFPDEPALLIYLNLREVIALAERAGLASDPAYATVANDLRLLPAAALAVERGESELDTLLRVSVAAPPE